MDREYTPDNILELPENGIFVFGSNTEGRHGKGAALIARQKFGAIYGQPYGLQGQAYAIVTKDLKKGLKSIPLTYIGQQLIEFIAYANIYLDRKFYVCKLGSSLAGYSIDEIRQIFFYLRNSLSDNIILPKEYEVRDNGK